MAGARLTAGMGLSRRTVAIKARQSGAMAGTVNRSIPGKLTVRPPRCAACSPCVAWPAAKPARIAATCAPPASPPCPGKAGLPPLPCRPGRRALCCLPGRAATARSRACRVRLRLSADRLLPRLKFHGDFAAGRCWRNAWSMPCPPPTVPMRCRCPACARLRQRGYDQASGAGAAVGACAAGAAAGRRAAADPRHRRAVAAGCRGAPAQPARAFPGGCPDDGLPRPRRAGRRCHDHRRHPACRRRALRDAGVRRVDAWVCARVA